MMDTSSLIINGGENMLVFNKEKCVIVHVMEVSVKRYNTITCMEVVLSVEWRMSFSSWKSLQDKGLYFSSFSVTWQGRVVECL